MIGRCVGIRVGSQFVQRLKPPSHNTRLALRNQKLPTLMAATAVPSASAETPLPVQLSFLDFMALLPEHSAKPFPDCVARDWFNLAVHSDGIGGAGVDGEERVDRDTLFQWWSVAVAPHRLTIESRFAKYSNTGKKGTLTITEDDFKRLAEDIGFGAKASSLFEDLVVLTRRQREDVAQNGQGNQAAAIKIFLSAEGTRILQYDYSTLMTSISDLEKSESKGKESQRRSHQMKIFLAVMAGRSAPCRRPHIHVWAANESKPISPRRRRVWRSGPPRPKPLSEASLVRQKLITAIQAAEDPCRGELEYLVAQRREDEMWDRYRSQKRFEGRRAERVEREFDVLVKSRSPDSAADDTLLSHNITIDRISLCHWFAGSSAERSVGPDARASLSKRQ